MKSNPGSAGKNYTCIKCIHVCCYTSLSHAQGLRLIISDAYVHFHVEPYQ